MTPKETFLDAFLSLAPWLDKKSKSELESLQSLFDLFPGKSLPEIVKQFVKFRKENRSAPSGMADRSRWFRAQVWPDDETPESADAILADFSKMAATKVKELGKLLDIYITGKTDGESFRRWLETGVKPLTEEERIENAIETAARQALSLRDQTLRELAPETKEAIMLIVTEVQKKYKVPGLKVFVAKLGYLIPRKATGPNIVKEIKMRLEDLAIARMKGAQIDDFGNG